MAKRRPVLISIIALLQVLPIVLLPPQIFLSVNRVFFAIPLVLFAVLAWALLSLRPAGRLLSIFLQGLNIIVRVLIALARVVPSKAPGTPVDVPLLVTSVISIVLSTCILFYVDQPEIQLLFEA